MGRAQELREALRVLAPGSGPPWLVNLENKLRGRAEPRHNKRARLKSPIELIQLGRDLMSKAETASGWSSQRRAVHFRDGLAIALWPAGPCGCGTSHPCASASTS